MTWLLSLLSLIPSGWLLGALGMFGVGIVAYFKGRNANSEKLAEARRNMAAAKEHLEMNREATAIERQIAGMSDDEAKQEAMKWARK